MELFLEKIVLGPLLTIQPDKKKAGYLLHYIHSTLTICVMIIFLSIRSLRLPIFILNIPVYIYHFIYKKCPLTDIEKKLHNTDSATIWDYILRALYINPTRELREFCLVATSTIGLTIMLFILYLDFHHINRI